MNNIYNFVLHTECVPDGQLSCLTCHNAASDEECEQIGEVKACPMINVNIYSLTCCKQLN